MKHLFEIKLHLRIVFYMNYLLTTMRKLVLIAFLFPSYVVSAQQAESNFVKEQPNGIKIYEQVGVPNPTSPVSEVHLVSDADRRPKTLNEFTYDECVDAIKDISRKIRHLQEFAGNDEEIRIKQEEIERIKRHLVTLKPN